VNDARIQRILEFSTLSKTGTSTDMNTKSTAVEILRPLALGLGIFGAGSAIATAQVSNPSAPDGPVASDTFDANYATVNSWQSAWDRGNYDRNHVLLGTVGSFAPYRLTLQSQQGDNMTVDLKNGTVIRPTGTKPMPGERVAVFGYWSNGTFIASRVVVHG
jgi:hypothetical protein